MKKIFSKLNKKNIRSLIFLLPAGIFVALVLITLPLTAPILKQIPEKLKYIAPVIAEAATLISGENKADKNAPEAFFDYKDGTYTGQAYGYGGDVQVQVTVKNGYITDITILSSPGETEPYFTLAKTIIDTVIKKQTWEVDAVSGATYSSNGILGAVQNAITGEIVENERPVINDQPIESDEFEEPSSYKDGTYTGSAQGFGGQISVQVVIKDGKISDIMILDASGETPDYLANARSVIPAMLSKGSPNVDTVSGATYSSNGIINAVKRALAKAGGEDVTTKDNKTNNKNENGKKEKSKREKKTDFSDSEFIDGSYTGTGTGFGGDIKVKVTIKSGKISAVTILSSKDETPEYFSKAVGVIKNIIKNQSTDVDVISGATFSSNGILDAVDEALSKAAKDKTKTKKEKETKESATKETKKEKDDPVQHEDLSGKKFADGTFEGTGEGFGGDIILDVTVKDGEIKSIDVVYADDETPSYLSKALNIINIIISAQDTNVDVISGATFSSNGIIEAVEQALLKSSEKYAEEQSETESTSEKESETEKKTEKESESSKEKESSSEEKTTEDETKETKETEEPEESKYKDGTYSASAWCDDGYEFSYLINVSVTIEDGKITGISESISDDESEYPEDNVTYINWAKNGRSSYPGVYSQVINSQQADSVDVVSRATYSSNAMIAAIRDALSQAAN